MRRRAFMMLASAVVAAPLASRAQQAKMPVVGYLNPRTAEEDPELLDSFRRGLAEIGYVEGRSVAIEFRWADDQFTRLPDLAADLVSRRVDVIAALGGGNSVRAVSARTSTIPIIFNSGGDPVAEGMVASLSRPAGNLTGITMLSTELNPKKLELLHQLLPDAKTMALLVNPNNVDSRGLALEGARALGIELHLLYAGADADFDGVFAKLAELRAGALLINNNAFLNARFKQIASRALGERIPTIFGQREAAVAGGLMSYGGSLRESYRLAGVYAGRILKGEKPADLPVQQVTKVELIINLNTAKALAITFPPALLARADEVIE
jgi:putative ABC transport system substrate-binding protein